MKDRFLRQTILVAFVLLASGCIAINGETKKAYAEDSETSINLSGPTMPVADLDASVDFFVNVMGMTETQRVVYNNPVMRALITAPQDADINVVILGDSNSERAVVLVGVNGLEIDTDSNIANATALSLLTTDLDSIYNRAMAGGHKIIMSPEEAAQVENYPPEKEMILVAPSGHRLLVIQPPTENQN